jgi:hypothetical protein
VQNAVEQSLQHCEELWNLYKKNGDIPTSFSWKGPRFQVRKVKVTLTSESRQLIPDILSVYIGCSAEDVSDHEEGFNLGDRHAFNTHSMFNPVPHV